MITPQGFFFKNVQTSTSDKALLQRLQKLRLIDDSTSRCVDQNSV